MFDDTQGPIQHFSWGRYVVLGQEHGEGKQGTIGVGKDIRLIGGQVSPWVERKGHRLNKSMITGVYGQGIEVLIIGCGIHGRLKCPEKTRQAIHEQGIEELVIERTPQACETYNRMYREGRQVALLAHGTC